MAVHGYIDSLPTNERAVHKVILARHDQHDADAAGILAELEIVRTNSARLRAEVEALRGELARTSERLVASITRNDGSRLMRWLRWLGLL